MNTQLRKKRFLQAHESRSIWKNYGNVRKHRDIKFATTQARRNCEN